jgi:acyl-CoA reductase-like NAD-dependent aldehyde dehydrogenase
MGDASGMTDLHTRPQLTTIEVRNPADGSIVGSVPNDSAETVAAKAAELRTHQPEWEAIGPRGRKTWLLKFQDWVVDNAEHLTDVVQSETGKVRADASIEAPMTAGLLDYWARNAEGFLGDRHPKPHTILMMTKRLKTVYRPYPVVGLAMGLLRATAARGVRRLGLKPRGGVR